MYNNYTLIHVGLSRQWLGGGFDSPLNMFWVALEEGSRQSATTRSEISQLISLVRCATMLVQSPACNQWQGNNCCTGRPTVKMVPDWTLWQKVFGAGIDNAHFSMSGFLIPSRKVIETPAYPNAIARTNWRRRGPMTNE